MNENPFILFKNTVNVLVVDDMPLITETVKEFLDMFKIYTVSTANSTKEAMDIIEKAEKRYHACLFDLGMNDLAGNEFHLLDTYKKIIPFIIMTMSEDREKAFKCSKRGAKDFVSKTTPTSFNFNTLIKSLNNFALLNMLYPEYDENDQSNICKYINALVDKDPYQVKDWAKELELSDREVRYIREGRLDLNPKQTLCVYHLFSRLFNHIDAACNSNGIDDESLAQCGRSIMESPDFNRWLDYYFLNIKDIKPSIYRLPRALVKENLHPMDE
jgi:DNA-binding response OmpR family regulator